MRNVNKIFFGNKWNKSNSLSYFYTKSHKNKKFYYPDCSTVDLNNSIASAKKGLDENSKLDNNFRSKFLRKVSKIMRINSKYLAKLESLETGKNFKQALKEINHCIELWSYASKIAKTYNENYSLDKKHKGLVRYEPVGIVGLIIPWNYPLIVTSERLPFILAAGNSVIIKPSEHASQSIIYLIKILFKSGLPKGVVNLIFGKGERIGKKLVINNQIRMISFTGSTSSGKKIMEMSSNKIKRLSLELGGKNPIIVFSDANLKKTVKIVIKSFTANAGQACVATSRLLIDEKIKKNFIKKLIDELNKLKSIRSLYGPISNQMQYERIINFLKKTQQLQKKLIYGNLKNFKNNLIGPIIFLDLPRNHVLVKSEIFGPILTINSFKNENDALKLTNDTNYGLSAVICGKNEKRNISFANKIEAGRIWINESIDKNYPVLPIGGFKESGLNRECGKDAIKNYSEIKSIIIKK